MFWIAWPAAPFTRLSMTDKKDGPSLDPVSKDGNEIVVGAAHVPRSSPGTTPASSTRTNGSFWYRAASAARRIRAVAPPRSAHVDAGENAAVHRHQVRREVEHHRPAGGGPHLLFDLRCVAVRRDAVGVHPLRHLGEQRALLRRAAGPRHARFGVDDDIIRVDQSASPPAAAAAAAKP